MNEVFEKIIEKLEIQKDYYKTIRKNTYCRRTEMDDCDSCRADHYLEARLSAIDDAIEIVKQEAEKYEGGWILCSERLPETSGEYLTWVKYDGKEFHSIDEIDCDGIFKEWNCSSDYKIIAWMHLPTQYQPKGE